MSLAIEQFGGSNGYQGGDEAFTLYIPDDRGDIYVFVEHFDDSSSSGQSIEYNGSDISTLADYAYDEDSAVCSKSVQGNKGWFKIPAADLGSQKTLKFDWVGSNPEQSCAFVMVSGLKENPTVIGTEFDQQAGYSTPYSVSTSLKKGEMLLGLFGVVDEQGTASAGFELVSKNDADAGNSMIVIDYAKDAGKTGTVGVETADGTADIYAAVYKLVPEPSGDTKAFQVLHGKNTGASENITLPDFVDYLVCVFAKEQNATGLSALSYNSEALAKLAESDNASGRATVEIWGLANPDTGSSYSLTPTGEGGRDTLFWVGLCNVSGVGDSDADQDDTASGTKTYENMPALTAKARDLIIDGFADYRNIGCDANGDLQWEFDESSENYGAISQAPGEVDESVTMFWKEDTSDWGGWAWAGVVFEGAPGGGEAPLPVMLGANF